MTQPAAPSATPTTTPAATRGSRESTITAELLAVQGKPVDIGKAVGFLTSDDANYINGVTLPVDGGYSVA